MRQVAASSPPSGSCLSGKLFTRLSFIFIVGDRATSKLLRLPSILLQERGMYDVRIGCLFPVGLLGVPLANNFSLVPPITVLLPKCTTKSASALKVAETTASSISLIPNKSWCSNVQF